MVALEFLDVVNNGYFEDEFRKLKKKNARTIFVLNQSIIHEIYPRISYAQKYLEGRNILKNEYKKEDKITMVKLQTFSREYKTIQDYFITFLP